MSVFRHTTNIIRRTEETLKTAKQGLEDLIKGPPERKLSGLRNLVVFGRAVTNVLQNLRSTEPDFDAWYEKYREEMKNDPLMKYFYKLRSKILKKGLLETSTHVYIRQLQTPEDLTRFGPPPPNAKGFFIGDELGGSGWEVQLPDGSIKKYYVELPQDIGFVSLHFPDAPKYHLGQEINDTSIPNLAKLYIDYLRRLVMAAKEKFRSN
ncbi:MAG: hypothetical protein ACTSPW_19945 [Promethearchaeota archaeon]